MKTIHLATACLLFTAFSCGNAAYNKEENEKAMAVADSLGINGFVSSSAAVQNKKDTLRKFIRTADLKFKVNNVVRSTCIIEDLTGRHNGFVTLSDLHSSVSYTNITKVSADSSLETTYYTTENVISLRVPNWELDSLLKDIAAQVAFLDSRVIRAEDVSLQLLSNKWGQKRAEKHYDRLEKAIETKAKKLRETNEAEEALADKESLADLSRLMNLSLIDQVNYSTVNLKIYQRQSIKKELVENEKSLREYEPSFFSKIKTAMADGLWLLENLMLSLVKIWPLIILAVLTWFFIRKYYRKGK